MECGLMSKLKVSYSWKTTSWTVFSAGQTLCYEERETTVRDRLLFHWSWVCAPMWRLCQNVNWHHFLLFCKKHMTQRQQERKKKGLISETTTLQVHHTFLYISLPFLHHYSIVMPNFMFYRKCKQATTKFYFSLWAWIWSLGIQLEFGSLHLTKAVGRNNRDKNWKNLNLQQAHLKQMHFWT